MKRGSCDLSATEASLALQTKFNELPSGFIDHSELKEIEKLLALGANPNFYLQKSGLSLLAFSITQKNIALFKILLNFKVDLAQPTSNTVFSFSTLVHDYPYTALLGKLPLQLTANLLATEIAKNEDMPNNIIAQMHTLLSEQMNLLYPAFYQKIEAKIDIIYSSLLKKLIAEKEHADRIGKNLLVLIGDQHCQIQAQIIENILLYIATDHFNVRCLFIEDNKIPSNFKHRQSLKTNISIMQEKQGVIIPVDLARNQAKKIGNNYNDYEKLSPQKGSIVWNMLEEGMRARNQVISEIKIQSTAQNSVSIVGGNHLYGLVKHTFLANNFHLMLVNVKSAVNEMNPFETIKNEEFKTYLNEYDNESLQAYTATSYYRECIQFRDSREVTQAQVFSRSETELAKIASSVMLPQEILTLVQKVHHAQLALKVTEQNQSVIIQANEGASNSILNATLRKSASSTPSN
ncbi:MAG: hypothetical protein JSS07_07505 [Proteobacteria bacterium]|nr:hypothetical protein [Pseudomonadota bacterium]